MFLVSRNISKLKIHGKLEHVVCGKCHEELQSDAYVEIFWNVRTISIYNSTYLPLIDRSYQLNNKFHNKHSLARKQTPFRNNQKKHATKLNKTNPSSKTSKMHRILIFPSSPDPSWNPSENNRPAFKRRSNRHTLAQIFTTSARINALLPHLIENPTRHCTWGRGGGKLRDDFNVPAAVIFTAALNRRKMRFGVKHGAGEGEGGNESSGVKRRSRASMPNTVETRAPL